MEEDVDCSSTVPNVIYRQPSQTSSNCHSPYKSIYKDCNKILVPIHMNRRYTCNGVRCQDFQTWKTSDSCNRCRCSKSFQRWVEKCGNTNVKEKTLKYGDCDKNCWKRPLCKCQKNIRNHGLKECSDEVKVKRFANRREVDFFNPYCCQESKCPTDMVKQRENVCVTRFSCMCKYKKNVEEESNAGLQSFHGCLPKRMNCKCWYTKNPIFDHNISKPLFRCKMVDDMNPEIMEALCINVGQNSPLDISKDRYKDHLNVHSECAEGVKSTYLSSKGNHRAKTHQTLKEENDKQLKRSKKNETQSMSIESKAIPQDLEGVRSFKDIDIKEPPKKMSGKIEKDKLPTKIDLHENLKELSQNFIDEDISKKLRDVADDYIKEPPTMDGTKGNILENILVDTSVSIPKDDNVNFSPKVISEININEKTQSKNDYVASIPQKPFNETLKDDNVSIFSRTNAEEGVKFDNMEENSKKSSTVSVTSYIDVETKEELLNDKPASIDNLKSKSGENLRVKSKTNSSEKTYPMATLSHATEEKSFKISAKETKNDLEKSTAKKISKETEREQQFEDPENLLKVELENAEQINDLEVLSKENDSKESIKVEEMAGPLSDLEMLRKGIGRWSYRNSKSSEDLNEFAEKLSKDNIPSALPGSLNIEDASFSKDRARVEDIRQNSEISSNKISEKINGLSQYTVVKQKLSDERVEPISQHSLEEQKNTNPMMIETKDPSIDVYTKSVSVPYINETKTIENEENYRANSKSISEGVENTNIISLGKASSEKFQRDDDGGIKKSILFEQKDQQEKDNRSINGNKKDFSMSQRSEVQSDRIKRSQQSIENDDLMKLNEKNRASDIGTTSAFGSMQKNDIRLSSESRDKEIIHRGLSLKLPSLESTEVQVEEKREKKEIVNMPLENSKLSIDLQKKTSKKDASINMFVGAEPSKLDQGKIAKDDKVEQRGNTNKQGDELKSVKATPPGKKKQDVNTNDLKSKNKKEDKDTISILHKDGEDVIKEKLMKYQNEKNKSEKSVKPSNIIDTKNLPYDRLQMGKYNHFYSERYANIKKTDKNPTPLSVSLKSINLVKDLTSKTVCTGRTARRAIYSCTIENCRQSLCTNDAIARCRYDPSTRLTASPCGQKGVCPRIRSAPPMYPCNRNICGTSPISNEPVRYCPPCRTLCNLKGQFDVKCWLYSRDGSARTRGSMYCP